VRDLTPATPPEVPAVPRDVRIEGLLSTVDRDRRRPQNPQLPHDRPDPHPGAVLGGAGDGHAVNTMVGIDQTAISQISPLLIDYSNQEYFILYGQ
jgi:hypothetical protein